MLLTPLDITVHFAATQGRVKSALVLEKGDPNKSASTSDLAACQSETEVT